MTTWGSYGDLFPILALGCGLRQRGHEVIVATPEFYRQVVTDLGLMFRPIRPALPDINESEVIFRRLMDRRRGTERVVREGVLPGLADMYEDLSEIARGADLIGATLLALAGRLVAEVQEIPWFSVALQPSVFLSTSDPSVFGVIPGMERLRPLPPVAHRLMNRGMTAVANRWTAPWQEFRRDLGLPRDQRNPLLRGQFSPDLVLAMFSEAFARPQPDWPEDVVITGFPFADSVGNEPLPQDLADFLDAGAPPIVFTLGTSAVFAPGKFYEESVIAARAMGRRAVLLSGFNLPTGIVHRNPDIMAVTYASHAQLFPRAAAVVHQGGIGTCSQAMRAGKVMIVVPHAHDQPDNAARLADLGVARVISPGRYRAPRVVRDLELLLADPGYQERAAALAAKVNADHGVAAACDAIAELFDAR